MESLEVTSLSSRGQIVIPQNVRDKLDLHEGEKFVVIGRGDMILLKKIQRPSFEGFDELLKETREWAKKTGVTPNDVEEAIKKARGK